MTTTMLPVTPVLAETADVLLADVAIRVQLSPTAYDKAVARRIGESIRAGKGRHQTGSGRIVPWTSEWLACYEIWLATGKWLGGGTTPGEMSRV
ncbi:MAG: hypothetical protein F4018_15215 [Acidobacteria bacterium]|nr:hypothetical protein [Acidobacteriota bacterium]MYH28293.1 hypothetical protein [Acidobacteriota bacterium]MYK89572.1 hypothetical protein [Acidobacteriota bacterium]